MLRHFRRNTPHYIRRSIPDHVVYMRLHNARKRATPRGAARDRNATQHVRRERTLRLLCTRRTGDET